MRTNTNILVNEYYGEGVAEAATNSQTMFVLKN